MDGFAATNLTGYAAHALSHLQASGLRITRPRRCIVELLERSDTPLTAPDIHCELKRRRQPIDQASIYRTLGLLEDHGLVHNVGARGGFVRCHGAPGASGHIHLVCRRCHRATPVPPPRTLPGEQEARKLGFHVERCRIELHGTCRACTGKGD